MQNTSKVIKIISQVTKDQFKKYLHKDMDLKSIYIFFQKCLNCFIKMINESCSFSDNRLLSIYDYKCLSIFDSMLIKTKLSDDYKTSLVNPNLF